VAEYGGVRSAQDLGGDDGRKRLCFVGSHDYAGFDGSWDGIVGGGGGGGCGRVVGSGYGLGVEGAAVAVFWVEWVGWSRGVEVVVVGFVVGGEERGECHRCGREDGCVEREVV